MKKNVHLLPDEDFIDMVQKQTFQYFMHEYDAKTGLVRDRADNFDSKNKHSMDWVGNCATTGFGIAALCIAESRGWITRINAYSRILTALKTFRDGPVNNANGFFCRFNDLYNGHRIWDSEFSSIDTALFLSGALFTGQYFKGTEIESVAYELYKRVNWQWMCHDNFFVNMAWFPPEDLRHGFFMDWWNRYCEGMLVNILAIGSPTHPIDPIAWKVMIRPRETYKNYSLVTLNSTPNSLFVHQFTNLFVDFRGKHDGYMDYFENARIATLANRQFCIDHMVGKNEPSYKTYGPNCWGLSEGDGPQGYKPYGSLPGKSKHDGTVGPNAVLGSTMFTPKECIDTAKFMYDEYKDKVWGRYGFVSGFNVDQDWWDKESVGTHAGAAIVSIENYRSGLVWDTFMKIPYIQDSLKKCGFVSAK